MHKSWLKPEAEALSAPALAALQKHVHSRCLALMDEMMTLRNKLRHEKAKFDSAKQDNFSLDQTVDFD